MSAARFFGVLVVVVVLQTELFSELRIFGVMPELLLGLTIASGWSAGANRGAVAGFVAGIVYDVFLSTPLGLTALTYTLVGYAVGRGGRERSVVDRAEPATIDLARRGRGGHRAVRAPR